MSARTIRHLLLILAVLALPAVTSAQEATIGGAVRDTTGGVLPGVTVRAIHEATGNAFETVTDERGGFRVAVRTGTYRIIVELSGFATLTRTGLEVLVGQQVVVGFEMAPSGLQETLTVTAEAPLLDRVSSQLGGNVDPRQLSELPVNGRNWLDLTTLTPGSRTNATSEAPVGGEARGTYQLNVDGQQVTNYVQYNRRESALQPRCDRRVRVHRESVRRDAGPVDGRASERGDEVGHQHAGWKLFWLLPARPAQRAPITSSGGVSNTRINSSAAHSAGRSGATACISS